MTAFVATHKNTFCTLFRPLASVNNVANNKLFTEQEQIKYVDENEPLGVKILGVHLDKQLNWNYHVDVLCSAVSKSIFAIKRVKSVVPHKAIQILYISLIHSRIQYGIEAWGNANNISKLFIKQNKAIRVVNNKSYRCHTDPLFKKNSILKVSDLFQLRVVLLMHDFININFHVSFKNYILSKTETNLFIYSY